MQATTSLPRGLDPGTTSVSGGSRVGTVCLIMQNPQSRVFSETPGRGVLVISVRISGATVAESRNGTSMLGSSCLYAG
eukprot:1144777-Pelagomonas_calceolata.AAC.1